MANRAELRTRRCSVVRGDLEDMAFRVGTGGHEQLFSAWCCIVDRGVVEGRDSSLRFLVYR